MRDTAFIPALREVPKTESEAVQLLCIGEEIESAGFTGLGSEVEVIEMSNSLKAYYWLHNLLENGKQLPNAIVADLNFIERDKFLLNNCLVNEKKLLQIPFIVISNENAPIDVRQMIRLGIDDCYSRPLEWKIVSKRINYLRRFKSSYERKQGTTSDDNLYETYQMPLGKRFFDITFSFTALLILSPLLLLIALAIKLESRGNIIYSSKRAGTGYQVFDFLKFRSMSEGADRKLKELNHLNQYKKNGQNPSFVKINNDPRVTRVGKFLRKTSLDELPQLVNILKGDMSIVGNRPLPLYEAEMLTKDGWAGRFLAPAGLTGLWQVSRRGGKDMSEAERVQLDVTYAEKYSFWYDLKIILRTFPAMIQQEAV